MNNDRAVASKATEGVKTALAARIHAGVERVLGAASPAQVRKAIEAQSDLGSLAALLADPNLADPALALDPLVPAEVRAVEHRRDLAVRAAPLLSASDLAGLLGTTRQAVEKRRRQETVLAVPVGKSWGYPGFQVEAGALRPGLDRLLRAMRGANPWHVLDTILASDAALNGRSLRQVMEEGDLETLDRECRIREADAG